MTGKWTPRRFGEHKEHQHLHRLMDSDLYEGDILLVKEWSNTDSDVRFIRYGQAMFSHVRGGSMNTEHVILNCRDGSVFAIESLGDGLNIGNKVRRRDHVVYSCSDDRLRSEACFVAERLANVRNIQPADVDDSDTAEIREAKHQSAYAAHKSSIKYRSGPMMAASVFRSKKQGRFAHARLQRIYDIVYKDAPQGALKMICSEFVAACYEVAALHLNARAGLDLSPFGGGVDPRALTAKAFEAILQRPDSLFGLAGRYAGTEPLEANEHAALKRLADLYVATCRQAQKRLSVDEAFDVIFQDHATWIINKHDVVDRPTWRSRIAKAYDRRFLASVESDSDSRRKSA